MPAYSSVVSVSAIRIGRVRTRLPIAWEDGIREGRRYADQRDPADFLDAEGLTCGSASATKRASTCEISRLTGTG